MSTIRSPRLNTGAWQGYGGRAVLIVGHGSLRSTSGAAMIRLAARVRAAEIAPIVHPAFLNYSRPTFAEGLARCVGEGASEIIVQPYFLVPGKFVGVDLPRLIARAQPSYPGLPLRLAQPLGDHPALAALVHQRALEADYLAAHPDLNATSPRRFLMGRDKWRPSYAQAPTALLMIAHGSPDPSANHPIDAVAARARTWGHYAAVAVSFLSLNQPSIIEAVAALAAQQIHQIIAVPYFLQMGNHVTDDLPEQIERARACYPQVRLTLAEHLGYDPALVAVIADRVAQVARLDAHRDELPAAVALGGDRRPEYPLPPGAP